jgi:peroxiredoxin
MTRKWILAAAAALGLALATTPFWWSSESHSTPGARSTSTEGSGAAAFCDAQAKPAPLDAVIKDMNGQDVRLADYKGKVILVNFWATWCGPCKVEIPVFVELQDKYRDQGVVFLGLSVDDPVEKLKPFADKYQINYPVLVGLGRDDVQESFGPVWGIPVTYLIDRRGHICLKHQGLATKEQFERAIQSLL